jgi:hypothetical protein
MNKTIKTITIAITVIAFLMSFAIIPANASTVTSTRPRYDLTGVWAFNFIVGGASYPHIMMINSFNPCTGAFSGIGYYVADPTYTWTVTGTESGNTVKFHILYTGSNPGYTVDATGTITSSTIMSGSATDSSSVSSTWTATKATLVVNVCWMVINDEDIRWTEGVWALDSGMQSVQVWRLPDGSWLAIKNYNEMFYTPKGASSPNSGDTNTIFETKSGYGTLNAQYIVSFTGTLATGVKSTGYLGVKNYGGSVYDIMLGAAGGSGNVPGFFSWMSTYFPGAANVVYRSDSWTYKLCDDKTATARSLVETNAFQSLNLVQSATPTAVGDIVT